LNRDQCCRHSGKANAWKNSSVPASGSPKKLV
jgi:hypothetical protein